MIPAYPLQWPEGWPHTVNYRRKSAQFRGSDRKSGLSIIEGRKRVLEELARLHVTHDDVVISTNLKLNLQGLPRGDQGEPNDPGVAVYWERNRTRRVIAIDHYNRVGDNLGAIAATLGAMRAIERHGGAQILERAFTGFVALPAPDSVKTWREVLGFPSEAVVNVDMVNARYRNMAAFAHPDKPTGSHRAMSELNRARDEALRAIGAT